LRSTPKHFTALWASGIPEEMGKQMLLSDTEKATNNYMSKPIREAPTI